MVLREAGRICVKVYAIAASGSMQYDYKQIYALQLGPVRRSKEKRISDAGHLD